MHRGGEVLVNELGVAVADDDTVWGQALSDYPPRQCRCRSRARASLRNRHRGPSIMGFEDGWNNLSGGLTVNRTAGPSGHANSPHPSSREGHLPPLGGTRVFSYRV